MSSKLAGVKIPVEVVLGSTSITLDEMRSLGAGTIIELESIAGEPVQLRAGGAVIAHGEVVVIDESFGIRVTALEPDESPEA
jgi:flagellar motor switch protein FliN/FliY